MFFFTKGFYKHGRIILGTKELLRLHLAETPDGAANSGGGSRADGVGAAGQGLLAATAVPDTDSVTLHGILAAECASVGSVLRNFNLLDLLPQRGTITGTVLAHNPRHGALKSSLRCNSASD